MAPLGDCFICIYIYIILSCSLLLGEMIQSDKLMCFSERRFFFFSGCVGGLAPQKVGKKTSSHMGRSAPFCLQMLQGDMEIIRIVDLFYRDVRTTLRIIGCFLNLVI